jgi:hypothetical protein
MQKINFFLKIFNVGCKNLMGQSDFEGCWYKIGQVVSSYPLAMSYLYYYREKEITTLRIYKYWNDRNQFWDPNIHSAR